jgi:hypothetical protein
MTPLGVGCVAIPNPVRINQSITWQAQVQGGSGSYSYVWLNGITASSYSKSYTAIGSVANWVIVTDRVLNQSKTANCSLSVTK